MELHNLKRRVSLYKEILENTVVYRQVWKDHLRDFIIQQLSGIVKAVELNAGIVGRAEMENLEAIALSLGDGKSGLAEQVGASRIKRPLIKNNGSLVYQQLFNGKVLVIIQLPFIEGYGEPHPPKQIGIYRPEELTTPFIIRHVEEFVKAITEWEDYDDDEPASDQRIGFKLNFNKKEQ